MLREDLENTARDAAQRQIRETIEYVRKVCQLKVDALKNLSNLKPMQDSLICYEEFDLGKEVRKTIFKATVKELRKAYSCLLGIEPNTQISTDILLLLGEIEPDIETSNFCERLKFWLETPTGQWRPGWRREIKNAVDPLFYRRED